MGAQNSTKSKVARQLNTRTQSIEHVVGWKIHKTPLRFCHLLITSYMSEFTRPYTAFLYCKAMGIWVGPWLMVQPFSLTSQNASYCWKKKVTFQCLWYMSHNLSILQNDSIHQFSIHNTPLKLRVQVVWYSGYAQIKDSEWPAPTIFDSHL